MNDRKIILIFALALIFSVSTLEGAEVSRKDFDQSLIELQGSPGNQELREKVIRLAQSFDPPPAIPKEAERFMVRGQAALEDAKGPEDFQAAVTEFSEAVNAAPWWADAYYNLGIAQGKLDQFDEAIQNLKWYLVAAPNAPDAKGVENEIYKIEFKKEKAQKERQVQARIMDLNGLWTRQDPGWIATYEYTVSLNGNQVRMEWSNHDGAIGQHWFEGTLDGQNITGTYSIDQSGWQGGRVFTYPFRGTVSEDGKTITIEYTTINITGAKGMVPTGWQEFTKEIELSR